MVVGAAGREVFWNIAHSWVFYGLALSACLVLAWGLGRRIGFILCGAHAETRVRRRFGIRALLGDILTHRIFIDGDSSRLWHVLVFYGLGALFLVTSCLMLAHYGFGSLYKGIPYLGLSVIAELGGAALLAGALVGLLAGMRSGEADAGREEKAGRKVALVTLLLLSVSGFLLEGLRLSLHREPWGPWSFVGTAASRIFLGLPAETGLGLHRILWWFHSLLALFLIAWLPFSASLRHLFFLPIQRGRKSLDPASPLACLDLEQVRQSELSPGEVRLGIERAADTTPGQRLGLLSCMNCGRCEQLCPAFQTGQPLSPRRYVRDLEAYVSAEDRSRKGVSSLRRATEAVSSDSLWACRLCLACQELCPAGIEHGPLIVEMRRAEVMGHGCMPPEAAAALRNLERNGNPYGSPPEEMDSWIQKYEIPTRPPQQEGALLVWTGCFPPGDEQKPRVLASLASLLRVLETPFFVLPGPSVCCGDPARVLGEEDLFQSVEREQIRRIRETGAQLLLVHCPHCYTLLKDGYLQFDAGFRVLHTSEFFVQALRAGSLQLKQALAAGPVAFHDPCFLGRYQGLFDPPREIIQAIPGLELLEPANHRARTLCCGAGGGHFFMDLDLEERPSNLRLKDILSRKANTLAVSCSFCASMFEDALRRLPDPSPLRVADWLELLQEATRKAG